MKSSQEEDKETIHGASNWYIVVVGRHDKMKTALERTLW